MLDDGFHPKFVSGFWSKAQTADEGVLFSMNHPLVGFKAMPKTIETHFQVVIHPMSRVSILFHFLCGGLATLFCGETRLSTNGGFHQWGVSPNHPFSGISLYKPSIWGYPHLWKPSYFWLVINPHHPQYNPI